jgi:Family of unknown function (DUF6519)
MNTFQPDAMSASFWLINHVKGDITMKGDFSRLTFDATKHFSRVMMQQGRVQLDADWNEQHAIFLHYLQTLTKDLIGEHGGPADNLGFGIIIDPSKTHAVIRARETQDKHPFFISKGRYYVDGIQISADQDYCIYDQPDYPWPEGKELLEGRYLVYLDVWEHHITSLEDASIREVALENVDTATRAKMVWQVKTMPLDAGATRDTAIPTLETLINKPRAYLSAGTSQKSTSSEPCTIAPESTYRGQENQLYRVEIYAAGTEFKIKWARDNASVVTAAELNGNSLKVNDPRGFHAGQWVEITNNELELLEQSGQLIKIKSVADNEITLEKAINTPLLAKPKVRRWDGADIPAQDTKPIPLADGIEIRLTTEVAATGFKNCNGDYWLIPARVATGTVEWPNEPQPPYGIKHHYAPLAIIDLAATTAAAAPTDLRNKIKTLIEPVAP